MKNEKEKLFFGRNYNYYLCKVSTFGKNHMTTDNKTIQAFQISVYQDTMKSIMSQLSL